MGNLVAFVITLIFTTNLYAKSNTETIITAHCPCVIENSDGVIVNDRSSNGNLEPDFYVTGTLTNPSIDIINSCLIENGEIVKGCGWVKARADYQCEQAAKKQGLIPTPRFDSCYGNIKIQITDENGKEISVNLK